MGVAFWGVMSRPRIAIIEDDPDHLWVLEAVFSDEAFETMTYTSYDAALPDLERGAADVVLSDCIDCDYLALSEADAARIRALAALAPTILHTARAWARRVDAADLGAVEIVPKPADVDDLLAAVNRALSHTRTED